MRQTFLHPELAKKLREFIRNPDWNEVGYVVSMIVLLVGAGIVSRYLQPKFIAFFDSLF